MLKQSVGLKAKFHFCTTTPSNPFSLATSQVSFSAKVLDNEYIRNYSKHTNINTYCTPRKHNKYSFFYRQIVSSLGFLADQTHNLFFSFPSFLTIQPTLYLFKKTKMKKIENPHFTATSTFMVTFLNCGV